MSGNLTTAGATGVKCGHLNAPELEHDGWSWDGDGLPSAERALWRSRRALIELVNVLLHDEAFVASVSVVRSARDKCGRAWQLARRYGIGDRRALVAALMTRAADHEDLDEASVSMCNLGAVAVSSTDEPRTARRSTYLIGDAFLAPVRYGCQLLAAKGRGQAVTRGEERHIRRTAAAVLRGLRRSTRYAGSQSTQQEKTE